MPEAIPLERLLPCLLDRLTDDGGREVARGSGTFMRSNIPLTSVPGYSQVG